MRFAFDFAFDDGENQKNARSASFRFVPEAGFVAQLVACHTGRQHNPGSKRMERGAEVYLASPNPSAERPQWISKIV